MCLSKRKYDVSLMKAKYDAAKFVCLRRHNISLVKGCVRVVLNGVLVSVHKMMIACLLESSCKVYAPQTKILEGRTNRPEHLFDALFNDS
jgi:hypothetical protein